MSTILASHLPKGEPEIVQPLRYNLKIRVYGYDHRSDLSHGYCVDDVPTGLSHVIGEFHLDIRQMTLREMRPMIQYTTTGHMNRRSKLFQEALVIFARLPNLYNRPKHELTKYVFGFIHHNGKDVKLIHNNREVEPISNLLSATEIFEHDLALIPYSQISQEVLDSVT